MWGFMLMHWQIDLVILLSQFLALAIGYFYFEGMRGTFSCYKLTKAQK